MSIDGLPTEYVQPTLEDAEEIARFEKAGRFYSVEKTEHGKIFLRLLYSKGIA